MMPSSRPPSMAPGMEPMPPNTAAVKALMPGMEPVVGVRWGRRTCSSTPAMAARAEPMAKVMEMVAVHVDAHELGRPLVLRAGPHGLAHLGLAGEPGEGQHDDDADQHGDQGHVGDVHPFNGQGALGDDGGKHLGVGAPQQQGGVLQKVADADGGDEHRQGGRLAQGLVGQPFDDHAQDGTHHHGQQDAHNGVAARSCRWRRKSCRRPP